MEIINVNQPYIKYISCINIFTQTLQYYFNYNESKYIKPYITNIIKSQFDFQIKYFIKKICVFLGSDIWKRIPYEEKINPNFLGVADNKKIILTILTIRNLCVFIIKMHIIS